MNTPTTPDHIQETAHLEKLRTQISTDIETMQQKEASLKEYEQRLRLLVEHAHHTQPTQPPSQFFVTAPASSQASLDAEWDKYNRSHALLEAARRGLTDDRLALKEREERLTLRENDVARRENWIKGREQEIAAAAAAKAAIPEPKPSFTSAPFLAARNLFSGGSK
jgi:mannose/cellobiose epimerase-like protein (N-acyl-D-glucosamine 2-epimerase family)